MACPEAAPAPSPQAAGVSRPQRGANELSTTPTAAPRRRMMGARRVRVNVCESGRRPLDRSIYLDRKYARWPVGCFWPLTTDSRQISLGERSSNQGAVSGMHAAGMSHARTLSGGGSAAASFEDERATSGERRCSIALRRLCLSPSSSFLILPAPPPAAVFVAATPPAAACRLAFE